MDPDIVVLLMLAVTVLSLALAGYYFFAAFDQARPALPVRMQSTFAARFAIDRFIWLGPVPANARRSYLLSHAYASLGFFCMTVLAAGSDSSAIAVGVLAAATAAATIVTLRCWFKVRMAD